MASPKKNGTESAADASQPAFSIQRIYVKDYSFEAPQSPQVFLKEWKPQLKLDLETKAASLDNNIYEVVLRLLVEVKIEDAVAMVIDLQQAGIFSIEGIEEAQLPHTLGSFCPQLLYPYACSTVSQAVAAGGFPQLYLAPVNFDMLFQQQEEQQSNHTSEVNQGE